MAIEMSLFLRRPSATRDSGDSAPEVTASNAVAGGGSRLGDALDLAAALGLQHSEARALWDRNANANPTRRFFAGPEISTFLALIRDLQAILPRCVNPLEGAVHPEADALLQSGVCDEDSGRLVLRRSRHGFGRVLEDFEAVSDLLLRADQGGCMVICDYEDDYEDEAEG